VITSTTAFTQIQFPCGEPHVTLTELPVLGRDVSVTFEFENAGEIVTLALLVDAIKRAGCTPYALTMPYVPFGRQDRVANVGEPLSISVFCEFINNLGFRWVFITDPHSDVTPALLKNVRVISQEEVFNHIFLGIKDFYLVSPDAGATKKIHKLAARVNPISVIQCEKVRDTKTGKITETKVHLDDWQLARDCYIVDDLCDGGGTFIAIAKELRKHGCGKIYLLVTHGFFTKGLEVFDGLIDRIYTRKGRIK
jgi:ribose-phosphate pyrophosphokinase